MNKQAFLDLLNNPEKISAKDLEGLEEVLQNFPYFQAARILEAKGAKNLGKMLAEQKVRKAAAYSAERGALKNLLFPKPVKETKLPEIETKLPEVITLPKPSFQETETKAEPIALIKPIHETKLPEIETKLPEVKALPEPSFLETEAVEPIALTIPETTEIPTTENIGPADWISGNFEEAQIIAPVITPESNVSKNVILDELESNLKALKELKAKWAKEDDKIIPPAKEETTFIKQDFIESEIKIETSEDFKDPQKDIEILPERIKEHSHDDEIASSRLDEMMVSDAAADRTRAIDEKELLLNYLSFLETGKKTKGKKKTEDIIDKFIKEDPSIPYLNKANLQENVEDKAAQSYKPKNNLVSENMAKIMALQGKSDKAIEIYEQLILKYPEKKAYFASQIEKLNQK